MKSIIIQPFKSELKQKYRLCRKTAQKLWNFAAQTHKTCMMNNLIQIDQETGLTTLALMPWKALGSLAN
jgi:hypothetical protein